MDSTTDCTDYIDEQMKLIIQIPCFNEAETLPQTLADLPREVQGFDSVEWLVVDDGSTDATVEVARMHGVDHLVSLPSNQGLARAFMAGLEASLRAGADVIVNTDADNQYDASCIPDLTFPIIQNKAMIVIGERPISEVQEFSPVKKFLQKLGSTVVKFASGTTIPDAPSGFRSFQREAAMRLYVYNSYTYTLETIIQAGRLNIPITSVPIRVNAVTRPSRLFKSIPGYVFRSISTILRISILYKPLRFFASCAVATAIPGLIAIGRFLYFYFSGDGGGHLQSLVLASALLAAAAVFGIGGILADLVAANRTLLQEMRYRHLKSELG
jgi:glycosyltransferase involved in cell wall biosynthesis